MLNHKQSYHNNKGNYNKSDAEIYMIKQGLIGEKECYCTQMCDIPDQFCEDCSGTGTITKLQTYLKKHGMEKTTLKSKRKGRTERVKVIN